MPLNHGYGLVIGTKFDYFRDPPDNFGRFYHGNLIVAAPAGTTLPASTSAPSTSTRRTCRTASNGAW